MNDAEKIERTARTILRLLAAQRYAELASLTRNHCPKEDIQFAMEAYDATACEPPEAFASSIDIIEIEGTTPPAWSVILPIWTFEEGESYLSVNITCIDRETADGSFEFDLNGIFVL